MRILAISSGKGGVGKSSVTVNLAAALVSLGYRVGVLDADVHGFSIPGLLGITGTNSQPIQKVDGRIQSPEAYGIRAISIGMFLEHDEPVAWRGPMLHRTVEQFLTEVDFGDPDFLLIDLPPGTGDVIISLAQLLKTAEILAVTTGQSVAADVAWRSAQVLTKYGSNVIGVIENMAASTINGVTFDLFGTGGATQAANKLTQELGYEVPVLTSIPIDPELRVHGDAGVPIVVAVPESPAANAFFELARTLSATTL